MTMLLLYSHILSYWSLLFITCYGLGLFSLRILNFTPGSFSFDLRVFWFGFAVLIGFLQVFHLFFPINGWTLWPLGALSLAGLFIHRKPLSSWTRSSKYLILGLLPLVLLFSVWIANQALNPRLPYDTGLYHWPTIKWIINYPIVFGLGNLHGRLAFNSSYFLYGALLNQGAWAGKAHHIVAGLFFLVLVLQSFMSAWQLVFKKSTFRVHHLFNILILPFVLRYIHQDAWPAISNYSPDIFLYVLGIVLVSHILLYCEQYLQGDSGSGLIWVYIAALSALGITIKLTFFIFGFCSFLLIFIFHLLQKNGVALSFKMKALNNPQFVIPRKTEIRKNQDFCIHSNDDTKLFFKTRKIYDCIKGLTVAGFLLVTWTVRGIILSGYAAYPSTIVSFPVSWKIPRILALEEALQIKSWARQMGPHWTKTLFTDNWMVPAVKRIPLELCVIGLALLLVTLAIWHRDGHVWTKSLVFIPITASILFWFFMTPTLRFAYSFFQVFTVSAISIALTQIKFDAISQLLSFVVFVLLFSRFGIPYAAANPLWKKWEFPEKIHPVPYEAKQTESGLVIHVPKNGDRAYDIPLPNTPYFNPYLRLKDPNNIRKGFIMDKVVWGDTNEKTPGFDVLTPLQLKVFGNWFLLNGQTHILRLKRHRSLPRQNNTPQGDGQILIYADGDKNALVSFSAGIMSVQDKTGNGSAEITLSKNGAVFQSLNIVSGKKYQIPVHLAKDFNLIDFKIDEISLKSSQNVSLNSESQPAAFSHEEFKKVLKISGLDKAEFAKRLGLSQNELDSILNEKVPVSTRVTEKILKVFGYIHPASIYFTAPIKIITIKQEAFFNEHVSNDHQSQ